MMLNYMNVYVKSKPSRCGGSKGLLSSCDNNERNDFVTSSGIKLLEGSSVHPLTQTSIQEVFCNSWRDTVSTFSDYLHPYNPAYGETCLQIESSSLQTGPVLSLSNGEFTVDIKFYLKDGKTNCSTLWSYSKDSDAIALLVCNSYISIYSYTDIESIKEFGSLPVQMNKWYQISAAWSYTQHSLFIYLIEENLSFKTHSYTVARGMELFNTGGTFMLGMTHQYSHSFVGYIDDLRIWKRAQNEKIVLQHAFRYALMSKETTLVNIWRFNEGKGHISVDASRLHIQFAWSLGNWADIKWSYASYKMEYMLYREVNTVAIALSSSDQDFAYICDTIINSFTSIDVLGLSAMTIFKEECIRQIILSGTIDATYNVLIALSDTIEPVRTSIFYPLRLMCNMYPGYSDWWGSDCNTYCIRDAGLFNKNLLKCQCVYGYWGESCNHQCMYANGKPCGGGICSTVDGSCECTSERFNATDGCKSCSDGWIGSDCSSIQANIPAGRANVTGLCFGQGHFVMFDGQAYDIHFPGEYMLFRKESASLSVYLRMGPCGKGHVCIEQIWINMAKDYVIFKTPLFAGGSLILLHNDEYFTIDRLSTYTVNSLAIINWLDVTTLLFVHGSVSVKITHLIDANFLSTILETSCDIHEISGLLGNCNDDIDDDFITGQGTYIPYSQINTEIINGPFVQFYSISSSVTNRFIYNYPGLPINETKDLLQGYGLFCNGTSAMSGKIPTDLFFMNKAFNVSLDFKVKVLSSNGFIIGYFKPGDTNKLSLYLNSSSLWLHMAGISYNVGFVVNSRTWYHIMMALDVSHNNVVIYINSEYNLLHTINLSVKPFSVPHGGHIVIGDLVVDPPFNFGQFIGIYGEIRIWNIVLNRQRVAQVFINPDLNVDDIGLHFQFAEGYGYVSVDTIRGLGFSLPPTRKVAWLITDKPGAFITSYNYKIKVFVAAAHASTCYSVFAAKSLSVSCSGFGVRFASFFRDACISDSSYLYSTYAYVGFCRSVYNPVIDPAKDLCVDFRSKHYQTLCADYCVHGTPTVQGCLCDAGYWSWNCMKICPFRVGSGGTPCYGHGTCDVTTGSCLCFQGFNSTQNCSECLSGYTGENCDKTVMDIEDPDTPLNKSMITCQLFGKLKIRNFFGNVYQILYPAEWYLIREVIKEIPSVRIRTVQCKRRVCLKAAAVLYRNETIVIDGSASVNNRMKINNSTNINTLKYFSYTPRSVNSFALATTNLFEFKMRLSVTFDKKGYMSMLLKTNCLNCTHDTICKTSSDFVENYSPENSSTFQEMLVPENESLLNPVPHEPITVAGNSLHFGKDTNMTSVVGTSILLFTDPSLLDVNVKVQIDFKPVVDQTGVIMQYVKESTFLLFLDHGNLKVQLGGTIIDTRIRIRHGTWCHIDLITDSLTDTVKIFATFPNSDLQPQEIAFASNSNIFPNGGRLVLGRPIPSFDFGIINVVNRSFIGEIDNVKFFLNEERYPTMNINFDNLSGNTIFDQSGFSNITIYNPFGNENIGTGSSSFPADNLPIEPYVTYPSEEFYQMAQQKCQRYFSQPDILNHCFNMSSNTVDVFRRTCIEEIMIENDDKAGIVVLQSFTTLCYGMFADINPNETATDPTKYLCSEDFTVAGYIGENCDIQCVNPKTEGDGSTCVCADGYWGETCANECPGGAANPCQHRGLCDPATGLCQCAENYQGVDCLLCSNGFYGKECQAVVTGSVYLQEDVYTASFSGNGYLKTFDGVILRLRNVNRVLRLFSTSDLQIEVQIGATVYYQYGITSIAIKIKSDVLILSPLKEGIIFLNGTLVQMSYFDLQHGYRVVKKSPTVFEITGTNKLTILILRHKNGFDFNMKIDTADCLSPTGIFGKCNYLTTTPCASSNLTCLIDSIGLAETLKQYEIGSSELSQYYTDISLEQKKTLFYHIDSAFAAPGLSLRLTHGYIILPELDRTILSLESNSRTIEMRIKFFSVSDGPVFSISNQLTTFGIVVINHNFLIAFGNNTFELDIHVLENSWTNIGIALNEVSGNLLVHIIHEKGYKYAEINIMEQMIKFRSPFKEDSMLFIGKWQIAGTSYVSTIMSGLRPPMLSINRFLLFNRLVTVDEFSVHFEINIANSSHGILLGRPSLLFNFMEGAGYTMIDYIQRRRAFLSSTAVFSWEIDSPPSMALSPLDELPASFSMNSTTKEKCSQLVAVLESKCKDLPNLLQLLYLRCQDDVRISGSLDNSIDSFLNAAWECKIKNDYESLPSDGECNSFGSRIYPIVMGKRCEKKCYFGTPVKDTCVCKSGYFGEECKSQCPGGVSRPCNNHGTCNVVTGECQCDENWNGDAACGSCSAFFSGVDCSEFESDPTDDKDSYLMHCKAYRKGAFTSFNSKRKKLPYAFDRVIFLEAKNLRILVSL